MLFALIFLTLFVAGWTNAEDFCPTKYSRFTKQHTFCLEPEETCQIKVRGLYNKKRDIHRILKQHNILRSKVALGEETQAGGLPTASNMMKLKWDEELAVLAQKWAEQCRFDHDCNECKLIENFPVGQNLIYLDYPCPDGECSDEGNGKKPDWEKAINIFYEEIENFDKKDLEKYGTFLNFGTISRFTQVIWANTWKVGCGFVAHQNLTHMRNIFVCNYGPTGNVQNQPIYIPGPPCSNCPINSCCGKTCKVEERFGGLCVMKGNNEAPKYLQAEVPGKVFHCHFEDKGVEDCKRTTNGVQPTIKNTLSGHILYWQLNGGEMTELVFDNPIVPNENFCFRITYRKAAADADLTDTSKLEVIATPKGGHPVTLALNYFNRFTYMNIVFDIPKVEELKFSVKLSVPEGDPEHIFELKEILAHNGSCKRA